jgi:tRNA threonylcarbamoyladenosine biosynthesis protein TsaE
MIHPDKVFRSVTLSELKEVAQDIVGRLEEFNVWLIHGEMGAGKTTLIKEICKEAGVAEAMSSPTFSIVNEYQARNSKKIFHFDFYRIKQEVEAVDIGTEEYFYSGYPCFVEWPEKIPSLMPDRFAEVRIEVETYTQRTIAIALHDGKKEDRF